MTSATSTPSSFFSSVLGSNYGIWTGISSKIEAAWNLSLEVLDSNSSAATKTDSASQRSFSSSCNSPAPPCLSSKQDEDYRTSRVSQYVAESQKYARRHRTTSRKDRSIYGQPEKIDGEVRNKTTRDSSQESIGTQDSGNSFGDSSGISQEPDPFYVFRHVDSLGIGSESDTCGPSTSLESSDAESLPGGRGIGAGRSGSQESIQSWASSVSVESQPDDCNVEAMEFMRTFTSKIFQDSSSITYEEKAKFGSICETGPGRLWFARCINAQRANHKRVLESTFYSLVQYFAIVLFECGEADDFSPAKSLMNMCFTFFYQVKGEAEPRKEYLYMYLKQQPVWKSLRFWNAAFFDAVQCERAHRAIPTRDEYHVYSMDEMIEERSFQENITFGQLGTFTCNMHAFGLSKELCLEFLRKQCTIANLPKEQVKLLRENIERMYTNPI